MSPPFYGDYSTKRQERQYRSGKERSVREVEKRKYSVEYIIISAVGGRAEKAAVSVWAEDKYRAVEIARHKEALRLSSRGFDIDCDGTRITVCNPDGTLRETISDFKVTNRT